MKQEINNYFKSDRSFEGAVILYNKYGKSMSIKKQFNLKSNDKDFLGILHDELRKLADMSLKQFQDIMRLKSQPIKVVAVVEDIKPMLLTEVPEFIKKTIKLRDHFPFLKEANCPKEAKILVADMISAYDKFRENQAKLFEVHSEQEIIDACNDIIEPYLGNRLIWDELESFKTTGEFLRQHPIFLIDGMLEDLKKMSAKELSKRQASLENNIRRVKKDIAENKRPDLLQNRKDSLSRQELELVEVISLLENK